MAIRCYILDSAFNHAGSRAAAAPYEDSPSRPACTQSFQTVKWEDPELPYCSERHRLGGRLSARRPNDPEESSDACGLHFNLYLASYELGIYHCQVVRRR